MQLLPDLYAWADESRGYIYDWRIAGDELRLTTAMANIGEGDMEVRGGPIISGQDQVVYQRIYNDDGTFTDVESGTFEYHEGHGHIHFEDFAHFRLREVEADGGVGDIVVQGEKVSFCLIDVARYDEGAGTGDYRSCGQVQGVSAGWADVYSSGLPGQSIDITGVADGSYWLEVEVDPENRLIESDETNNITRILIELDRGVEPQGDLFEDNDSFATASVLAPPEDYVYEDLSIHESGDADYYRFTASASGDMTFTVNFFHATGDIDMIVYSDTGTEIARSVSVTNNESITVSANEGDNFVVHVYGYNGATNDYTLEVDQPDRIDDYEPNDSIAEAIFIDTPGMMTFIPDLSVHTGNQDYFEFVAARDGQLKVHLDFEHDQGNIDARVIDVNGNVVASSSRDETAADPDHEHLQWEATAGATYYVHVFGADATVANPLYSLMIEQPPMNTDPDAGDDTFDPILASDLVGGTKINGTNVLLNDSDADGDTVSISAIDGTPVSGDGWQGWRDASNGGQIAMNTDGRVQFRDRDGDFSAVPQGERAETSITYSVSDGNGGTATATVTFVIDGTAVVGENLAPDAVDDTSGPILASALADSAKINGGNVLENDSDANGDTLSISEIDGVAVSGTGWQGWRDASNGGQIALNTDGRVQFRDRDGDFDSVPLGEQAETSITYTISDGNGGTDTGTITFVVNGEAEAGPNIAPVAQDDENGPLMTSELSVDGSAVKINGDNILDNDSDANGDALDIIAIDGVAVSGDGWQGWRDASNGGQIVINTDGRVQFRDTSFDFADLGAGETIDTSLDYTVSDGNGGTDTATVSFTISEDDIIFALDTDLGDTIV